MAITFDAKKNFAYSVVATAPSPASSGTSLVVAPGDGGKFPTPPFNAVVWPTSVQPTVSNAEVVRVTAIATDTFTIVRQQESSLSRSIVLNDQIAVNVTAKSLTDIEAAFATASQLTGPIGSVVMWLTDTEPTGWLFLRGQAISRATYSALFALIGTTYGAGDGSTTFNVPDLQLRLPIGKNSAGTLSTLGSTAGSWDHTHGSGTLTVASHTHGPGNLTVAGHVHGPGTLTVALHTHGSGTLGVASHTHGPGTLGVESHTHSNGTYGTSSDGSHSHTGTIGNESSHDHNFSPFNSVSVAAGLDYGVLRDNTGIGSGTAHSHSFTGGSAGAHTHDVTGVSSGTAPSVTTGATGAASPSVNSGSTASTAPAVDGGTTGAAASTVDGGVTGAAAPAVTSGVTGTGNPPVIALNFIVRATLEI